MSKMSSLTSMQTTTMFYFLHSTYHRLDYLVHLLFVYGLNPNAHLKCTYNERRDLSDLV